MLLIRELLSEEMATQEKLKKGFMSFYKFSTKNQKQKREPVVSTNKVVSQSHSLRKKLETCQDNEPAVVSTNRPAVLSRSHNSLQKKLESCQEIEPVTTANKQPVFQSHSLLLKRLENCPEIENGGRRGVERGENFVEGRKSVSHVESNLASVISFLQVKVLVSDMPGFMQIHAFRCARRTYDSLEKFSSKHIAYSIKKEFDKVYGPAWHCIVGSGFGSYVTHSTGCFLYFSMEKLYILVFKTKVQKAS